MSDDDDTPRNAREMRLIFRTVALVAVIVAAVVGTLIYGAVTWTRLVTRVESLEDRQKQKDRESMRELWRRDRGPMHERPFGGVERPKEAPT